MEILKQLASTTETAKPAVEGGILGVLGIDATMLIIQIAAFLVTLFLLNKFVFPWLIKSVDERQAKIELITKAATDAQSSTLETEKRIAKLLDKAKAEATDIMDSAKSESTAMIVAAEEKSRKRAEQIVADAKVEIDKDILAAKKALYNETVELVALATEKIIGKTISNKIDNSLITDAIKGIK